ncbi:hypothetical protein JTB14_034042 [Gonioctena quinquepunctata]|nr:hypothetical protein JTB14_034042 [Gonioctena quinquepunctata]
MGVYASVYSTVNYICNQDNASDKPGRYERYQYSKSAQNQYLPSEQQYQKEQYLESDRRCQNLEKGQCKIDQYPTNSCLMSFTDRMNVIQTIGSEDFPRIDTSDKIEENNYDFWRAY